MILLRAIPVCILALPGVASAAAPRTFGEFASLVVSLLDVGTGLLILAGIVIYFYGISTNIMKLSDEGGQKARAYFGWGILVLFVMVSIWGILNLLQNTLFGNNPRDPATGVDSGAAQFQVPQFSE